MIYYIILYLISLWILFKKNSDLFVGYIICYVIFFPLIIYWIAPSSFQYKGYFEILLIVTLFSKTLLSKPKLLTQKISIKLIVIIFLLFINILISSIITQNSSPVYYLYFRNYFWTFLLFISILSQKENINLEKLLFYIVIVQIGLGISQYFLGYNYSRLFSITEYVKNGEIVQRVGKSIIESSAKLIVGTFSKVTLFGHFLSAYLIFWFSKKKLYNQKLSLSELIFFVLGIVVMLMTGIRASFFSFFVGIFILFIVQKNYKTILFLITILIFYFTIFPYLTSIGNELISTKTAGSLENPFERITALFGVMGNLGNLTAENSLTLSRSIYLLQFISPENILWGNGVFLQTGYGRGLSSASDAQLIFIIVEYGLITFFLILSPFIIVLRIIKKRCSHKTFQLFLILFITIFIQTITDQGLFWNITSLLFYILSARELRETINSKALNNSK